MCAQSPMSFQKICTKYEYSIYKVCCIPKSVHKVCNEHTERTESSLCTLYCRRPAWWRQVSNWGTKQVYHAKPDPVIYIVPVTFILGRLALAPVGEHGTIPAALRGNPLFYPRGQCDQQGRPGTGSKLFYINMWAMTWPSDHPLPKKDQY
jgi:hypothetical protein